MNIIGAGFQLLDVVGYRTCKTIGKSLDSSHPLAALKNDTLSAEILDRTQQAVNTGNISFQGVLKTSTDSFVSFVNSFNKLFKQ